MKARYLLTTVVAAFAAFVSAGTIPAPVLQAGKHVYVVPPDFNPPLIGREGIQEIEAAASKLHFPYYVILVEALPGRGNDDMRAAEAINGLATDWSTAYPGMFDAAKSQIFLLTYEPRKYRFLAGSKFETEINFLPPAHQRYLQIFEGYVKRQRKDPKSGIVAMMNSVDAYLFDQTDPVLIERRRIEHERAVAAERLQRARSNLQTEADRLNGLLAEKKFLPTDVASYEQDLKEANNTLSKNVLGEMAEKSLSLRATNDVLEKIVKEKKQLAYDAAVNEVMRILGVILVIGLFAWAIMAAFSRRNKLKAEFAALYNKYDKMIQNAASRYLGQFGDRGDVISLTGATGKTEELYRSVTTELDDIFIGVEALRQRVEQSKKLASTGSLFRQSPYEKARRMLEQNFTFDTGKVDERSLFNPETRQVTVNPVAFANELEERFGKLVDSWASLKKVLASRGTPAEALFTSENLNAMLAEAAGKGIPARWLAKHPLYGDDTSDGQLYESINALMWNDPIGFSEAIEVLKQQEESVRIELGQLVSLVNKAKLAQIGKPPVIPVGIVIDPDDDPKLTYEHSKRVEGQIRDALANAETIDAVGDQVDKLITVTKKFAIQQSSLEKALACFKDDALKVAKDIKQVNEAIRKADIRVAEAKTVHANVNAAFVEAAKLHASRAEYRLSEANQLAEERKSVAAYRKLESVESELAQATEQHLRQTRHIDELNAKKREYEERIARISKTQASYSSKLREYDSGSHLSPFTAPARSDVADYVLLLGVLDDQESRWESQVRNARSEYEEEQRRRRQREADERRRRQEEEDRQRQASYHSSSSSWGSDSSSGSSWSSSSDSSSGGSWGGGSDSSSGGSW